jgi:DNA adenine methylase
MTGYPGGKYFFARWIISHFPPGYENLMYVEVFGGMGWVLLKKKPSKIEVFNDINGDIVTVFTQVRDNTEELQRWLFWTPYSRTLFRVLQTKWKNREFKNDLERAGIFIYLLCTSYGGKYYSTFTAPGKKVNTYRPFTPIAGYNSLIDNLTHIAHRLRNVIIENLDYRELLSKYDTPNTLFYLDPPYLGREYYGCPIWTEDDYIELHSHITKLQGKWILSHDEHPFVEELFKDYYCVRKERRLSLDKERRKKAVELLFMNYAPTKPIEFASTFILWESQASLLNPQHQRGDKVWDCR